MKKLLLFLLLPFVVSCGSGVMEVASSGKPYELVVVSPKVVWNGALGDSIKSTFGSEVLWLNQSEPIFDLLNLTPEGMNDNVRRHRNVMFITLDAALDSCSFSAKEDVWATNQQVMTLAGPSEKALTDYWVSNGEVIAQWLSIVERDRMAARASKYNDAGLDKTVLDKFGLKINIPKGYKVNADKENFLWLGNDIRLGTLGVLFYSFKAGGDAPKEFLKYLNASMAQVPGPSEGSFMAVDTVFMPEASPMTIDGVDWVQVKGFWKVENDFMGGPFVSYIAYDKVRGSYIVVDMFVNSPDPRYPKRNYMRQFEAIIMNARFQ